MACFSQMFKMLLIRLLFFFLIRGNCIKRAAWNHWIAGLPSAFILHMSLNSWHYRFSIFPMLHEKSFVSVHFIKIELAPDSFRITWEFHTLNCFSCTTSYISQNSLEKMRDKVRWGWFRSTWFTKYEVSTPSGSWESLWKPWENV